MSSHWRKETKTNRFTIDHLSTIGAYCEGELIKMSCAAFQKCVINDDSYLIKKIKSSNAQRTTFFGNT